MTIFDRFIKTTPEGETVSKGEHDQEHEGGAGDEPLDRQLIRNDRTGRMEIVTTNADGSKSVEPHVEPADEE